jgi:hypothetical protein
MMIIYCSRTQALGTREIQRLRPDEAVQAIHRAFRTRTTTMDEHEYSCSEATSMNELCPKCQAEYEEYLRVMAMLRKAVAKSESTEVGHADAA